jgi:thymidylate kinase
MTKGEFIVIYGANNLGKTTVVKKLIERRGLTYLKYPIYDLEPTGPLINSIIRPKEPVLIPTPALELQMIYAQNRRDYEPTLESILKNGQTVIAEDYTGTGMSWGMVEGIAFENLERINKGLKVPDKAILLDGERFSTGIERGHRFEGGNWEKARENFQFLAQKYGWEVVNANQTEERVYENICEILDRS